MTDSPLLNRLEAAAFYRVSARAFDQHVRAVVPTIRIGGRVLFHRKDLEAYIEDLASRGEERTARPWATTDQVVPSIVAPRPVPERVISLKEHIRAGYRERRGLAREGTRQR